MHEPSLLCRRTPAERADQILSWQRGDQAFFAAGACHILAWAFVATYPQAGFCIVALRKVAEPHASHVYTTNAKWAFDHCGWTREDELLTATRSSEPGCVSSTHRPGYLTPRGRPDEVEPSHSRTKLMPRSGKWLSDGPPVPSAAIRLMRTSLSTLFFPHCEFAAPRQVPTQFS